MNSMFQDRLDAGHQLASRLAHLNGPKTIVLGIPRGGVMVAQPIAKTLGVPLSVLIVRKIGAPGHEELALGAVSVDGKLVWNEEALRIFEPNQEWLFSKIQQKIQEVRQRKKAFGFSGMPPLCGKTAIVVDDGIATGASFVAALNWLKTQKPAKIVAAIACCPTDTARRIEKEVDEWVCLVESPDFYAVGQFYRDFREVSDAQVRKILARSKNRLKKTNK